MIWQQALYIQTAKFQDSYARQKPQSNVWTLFNTHIVLNSTRNCYQRFENITSLNPHGNWILLQAQSLLQRKLKYKKLILTPKPSDLNCILPTLLLQFLIDLLPPNLSPSNPYSILRCHIHFSLPRVLILKKLQWLLNFYWVMV